MVNVGDSCRGVTGSSGALASSTGAQGASSARPGKSDVDIDPDNDGDNDDHNFNASENGNDYNDDEALGPANGPPEDENFCWVCLLAGMVCTSQDYGLSHIMWLPNISADAPALFKAIELQVSTFSAMCSLIRAGGFPEEDLPISFRCLC